MDKREDRITLIVSLQKFQTILLGILVPLAIWIFTSVVKWEKWQTEIDLRIKVIESQINFLTQKR